MSDEMIKYYHRVLKIVCQVTGQEEIIHSNKEEAVDARTILIYILSGKGITDMEIARLTSLTRQGVNKLKNGFKYRKRKWSLSSNLQQISNELATECF